MSMLTKRVGILLLGLLSAWSPSCGKSNSLVVHDAAWDGALSSGGIGGGVPPAGSGGSGGGIDAPIGSGGIRGSGGLAGSGGLSGTGGIVDSGAGGTRTGGASGSGGISTVVEGGGSGGTNTSLDGGGSIGVGGTGGGSGGRSGQPGTGGVPGTGGTGAGGTASDAAIDRGPVCGPRACISGEYCCNAPCESLCLPEGNACSSVVCGGIDGGGYEVYPSDCSRSASGDSTFCTGKEGHPRAYVCQTSVLTDPCVPASVGTSGGIFCCR
jgi:hypothetical protein